MILHFQIEIFKVLWPELGPTWVEALTASNELAFRFRPSMRSCNPPFRVAVPPKSAPVEVERTMQSEERAVSRTSIRVKKS